MFGEPSSLASFWSAQASSLNSFEPPMKPTPCQPPALLAASLSSAAALSTASLQEASRSTPPTRTRGLLRRLGWPWYQVLKARPWPHIGPSTPLALAPLALSLQPTPQYGQTMLSNRAALGAARVGGL